MKFNSAYDILAVGKAKLKGFNNENPGDGSLRGFYSVKQLKLLGWLFFYSFSSNHLQMRWQITPAITETISEVIGSNNVTAFPSCLGVGETTKQV